MEAQEIKKNINPYNGMEKATSNNGNGEVVKVEDLISNPPEPKWDPIVDTLENADGELANLYERLEANPAAPEVEKVVKVEDIMKAQKAETVDQYDDLTLKSDNLISDLTNILNM